MSRNDVSSADDDVDLVGDDLTDIAEREHHDVQHVAGLLDLGALVALEHVLDDQVVDVEDCAQFHQQLPVGVDEVYPNARRTIGVGRPDIIDRIELANAVRVTPRDRPQGWPLRAIGRPAVRDGRAAIGVAVLADAAFHGERLGRADSPV